MTERGTTDETTTPTYFVEWWKQDGPDDPPYLEAEFEFDTLEEARECFDERMCVPEAERTGGWLELRVAGQRKAIDRASMTKPARCHHDEWQREIAMQAGMGLGVEAYNDAMGWGHDD